MVAIGELGGNKCFSSAFVLGLTSIVPTQQNVLEI